MPRSCRSGTPERFTSWPTRFAVLTALLRSTRRPPSFGLMSRCSSSWRVGLVRPWRMSRTRARPSQGRSPPTRTTLGSTRTRATSTGPLLVAAEYPLRTRACGSRIKVQVGPINDGESACRRDLARGSFVTCGFTPTGPLTRETCFPQVTRGDLLRSAMRQVCDK
jgi:hypothetical protein